MNNIFQNMVIPELGNQDFQQSFTEFCTAIKNNIERLMSVQYTKGEPGNSVYTQNLHIGYTDDKLTVAGASFLHSIFGTEFTPGIDDRQDVCDIITDIAPSLIVDGNTYYVIPSFMDDPGEGIDVNINIDKVTGKAYLSEPFIFIDGRIAGLNKIISSGSDTEIYKRFVDFSIAVYGSAEYDHNDVSQDKSKPETWEWIFTTVAIVPKLYFDDNINEFCWSVNGQQTGITAQGIKGDKGISPNMIIATGIYNTDNTNNSPKILIEKVEYIDDEGNIQWGPIELNNDIYGYYNEGEFIPFKDNDLAIVFYNAPENTNPTYNSAFIGKVFIGSDGPYVYMGFPQDGHTDVFETIRNFNIWSTMMSINTNTVGAPRGYILPANPNQSDASPETSEMTHMIYAEKGNQDSEGYAKLHMAPVRNNGDPANNPTRMSQVNNPSHHTGDMQLDYNVDIQGTMGVQGDATVKGDLKVQGKINAGSFTVLGKPFDTIINNTKLACVSRFKNINYSVKRTYNKSAKAFSYILLTTGILELNIGELSAYGDNNSPITQPHVALSGYGPNWQSDGIYSDASTIDHEQTSIFETIGCKQKSKLYNVLRYEIPFSMNKSVSSYELYEDTTSRNNIFGFNQIPTANNAKWSDVARAIQDNDIYNKRGVNSRYGSINTGVADSNNKVFENIALRYVINGFNKKLVDPLNPIIPVTYGCKILKSKDTGGILFRIIDGTPNGTNPCYNIELSSNVISQLQNLRYKTPNTSAQTPLSLRTDHGCLQGVIMAMDPSNQISPTTNQGNNTYSINGKLQYSPIDCNIEYHFDLYTRIFELDDTNWALRNGNYEVSKFTYNIQFDVTPVGYLCVEYNNNKYYTPIWNDINVKDFNGSSIRMNMKELNPNVSFNDTFTDNDSILNSLISQKYTNTIDCPSYEESSVINGPTGVIFSEEKIESQYIISPFEKLDNGSVIPCNTGRPLTANYFDITNTMRMVENNIKICPNNIASGSWKYNNVNENNISWESAEDIPLVIIPSSGYIGIQDVEYGIYKMGCGNFKRTEEQAGKNVSLQGLLMYPYTPCIITMNPANTTNPTNRKIDGNNDIGNGGQGGHHYISTGRIMGVSDGNIFGIATASNSGSSTIPGGWDDIIPGGGETPGPDEPGGGSVVPTPVPEDI